MEPACGSNAAPGVARPAAAVSLAPAVFRVVRTRQETADTFTLELAAHDRDTRHPFGAGQFNMLYAFGIGEVPISISGDPTKPEQLVHTIRAVGSVTRALCAMKKGDALGVRGPFGTAWPVDHAHGRDVLIVAGGIGLAPVRPILYEVLAHRSRYGRVVLLYGSRTPDDLLYQKELERWRSRLDLDVQVSVDSAARGWRGNVGFVTTLIGRAPVAVEHAAAFVCGPELMMRFTAQELLRRGLAAPDISISMERNMQCGVGLCGHCQCGALFICKDGPVFPLPAVQPLLTVREL
jgi:NAD(P)H-flavin reductase